MQQNRKRIAATGFGFVLTLAAQVAGQDVKTNHMPGVDFSKFHTYRPKLLFALAVFLAGAGSPVRANDGSDKDDYRWRVKGDWWFNHPRGDLGARSKNNYINFDEDLHFGDYSTFPGKVDWRFHRDIIFY